MTDLRIAGAPITWGVCEVPGWGAQLPVERVLREMAGLGLTATELGPRGFLPTDATRRAAVLADHRLLAVGAFLPVVLHEPDLDPLPRLRTELRDLVATGVTTAVLAADTGTDGYDSRPRLDAAGWARLLRRLAEAGRAADDLGVTLVLHPHVGTLVEDEPDVRRVLGGCDVGLCLDSGHLLIGGTDPVALSRDHGSRVRHVHLKDVDVETAGRVRSGELTYAQGVRHGLYRPLGSGDVDVPALVRALIGSHYEGWFVLEQDTVLDAVPPEGSGPVAAARASLAYLRSLAAATGAP